MTKVDILWSPNHDDKFVTFGSEPSLYKLERLREGGLPNQQAMKVSEEHYASLLSTNTDNPFIKCLAWYPKPDPDHLLAVGLANGKVVLSSFGKAGTGDTQSLIGKEFVPKHARQCNHLAWNPTDSNLLAEALEKYRADYSILIWDVMAKGMSSHTHISDRRISTATQDTFSVSKPLVELGPSETTLSLAWFATQPKTLVTGMNHKFLRIYDLRDISRPQNVAYNKAVYGLCIDPLVEHRLASFTEGRVSVWDTRNFDKPVLTLQDLKQVVKVAWSPTRGGLLGVLHRDSPIVKLYDIQNAPVGSDELEPLVIERIIQPAKQGNICSFDWHRTSENRMLTVSATGQVRDIRVFERISVAWSPDVYLTWACGKQYMQCNSIKLSREVNEDISIRMKRRAQRGYGLADPPRLNGQIVTDDLSIRKLWNWLDYVRSLTNLPDDNWGRPAITQNLRYLGIKSLLLDESGACAKSQPEYLQWAGMDSGAKVRGQKKVYRSDERSHALQLCRWGIYRDSFTLDTEITRLESEGEFERAAAIAVFNLQMKRAIDALQRGAATQKIQSGDINLSVVVMALSGFTEERNTLWHSMCSSQEVQLKNPYLKSIFAFLTTESDLYEAMLNDSHMELIDRVAFACLHLSDPKLAEYIKSVTQDMVSHGNLDGLLLTGLGADGIELLASYVDATSDVQTACLVALQGFSCLDIDKDERVNMWIQSYRELLDTWMLWHHRAEFDVFKTSCESSSCSSPQVYRGDMSHVMRRSDIQVYINCSFCAKSIANNMLANRSRHFMLGSTTSHRPKVSICPGCRKPLPRCALCLINMGTPAGTGKLKHSKDSTRVEEPNKLTEFSDWFTWCQTCRHGGHAHHIMEWFQEHGECPVTGCSCKCMSLDSMGHVLTDEDRSALVPT